MCFPINQAVGSQCYSLVFLVLACVTVFSTTSGSRLLFKKLRGCRIGRGVTMDVIWQVINAE